MRPFHGARCLILGAALLSVISCTAPRREAPPDQTATGPIHQDSRFAGVAQFRGKSGPDSARVEIRNIDLHPGAALDRVELPFDGQVIAYLQAGSVTVTIGGKSEPKIQGQLWTVAVGVPMGLSTGRDAASVQVVVVEQ